MKLKPSINYIPVAYVFYDIVAETRGSGVLTDYYEYFTLEGVSSTDYQTVFIAKYTVEDIGFIDIYDIFAYLSVFVINQGSLRWQISGDGGNTWTNIYSHDFIVGGLYETVGSGLWITSLDVGTDKLQIRLQMKKTGVYDTFGNIGDWSYITISYRKKVFK